MFTALVRTATFFPNTVENQKKISLYFHKIACQRYNSPTALADVARTKGKILNAISKRKPFQNFKNLIDSSHYRQNWFDFKNKAYINFVKQQIQMKEK